MVEYETVELVDGELVTTESREVNQNDISSECWHVQFQGLKACESCEYRDSDECGGKEIRETGGWNEKGKKVPLGE